jgi:hypothetical protein
MRGALPNMGKPGRKRLKYSAHKRLSSDARIIVALLNKQPQSRDELCKNANVPLRTFYRIRPTLEDHRIIKKCKRGYALWFFSELEEAVEDALFRLMKDGRIITVEQLANEVGKPWSEIESIAYAISKKHRLTICKLNNTKIITGWEGRKDLAKQL